MPSLYVLATVVLLTFSCFGQTSGPAKDTVWEPPLMDWPDELPRATVPKPMITALEVAGMSITLENTKLVETQQRLGGKIGHRGDAGESLHWLCLVGADQEGRWVLWLESSEVDGGTIGGFHLQRIRDDAKADSRCRLLSRREDRIELPIGLQLGMTESDVRKLLGRVTARKGNTLIFDHRHEQLLDGTEFTVTNTVAVLLNHDSVSGIQVWSTSVN